MPWVLQGPGAVGTPPPLAGRTSQSSPGAGQWGAGGYPGMSSGSQPARGLGRRCADPQRALCGSQCPDTTFLLSPAPPQPGWAPLQVGRRPASQLQAPLTPGGQRPAGCSWMWSRAGESESGQPVHHPDGFLRPKSQPICPTHTPQQGNRVTEGAGTGPPAACVPSPAAGVSPRASFGPGLPRAGAPGVLCRPGGGGPGWVWRWHGQHRG